jgi:hypothetical protein
MSKDLRSTGVQMLIVCALQYLPEKVVDRSALKDIIKSGKMVS